MKILWKNLSLLIVVLLLYGYASAGEVVDQAYKKMRFEGSKDRQYSVFLPEVQGAGEALPLVVALHGCNQTHRDIMNDTRFNDLAEEENSSLSTPLLHRTTACAIPTAGDIGLKMKFIKDGERWPTLPGSSL